MECKGREWRKGAVIVVAKKIYKNGWKEDYIRSAVSFCKMNIMIEKKRMIRIEQNTVFCACLFWSYRHHHELANETRCFILLACLSLALPLSLFSPFFIFIFAFELIMFIVPVHTYIIISVLPAPTECFVLKPTWNWNWRHDTGAKSLIALRDNTHYLFKFIFFFRMNSQKWNLDNLCMYKSLLFLSFFILL